MEDRYYLRRVKVADLLFDLVKYLLTAVGVGTLISGEMNGVKVPLLAVSGALLILIMAIIITPKGGK